MSQDAAQAFRDKLQHDAALRSKVDAIDASDRGAALAQVVRIASDAGFRVTEGEAEVFIQLGGDELSDADLDAISGGDGGGLGGTMNHDRPTPDP